MNFTTEEPTEEQNVFTAHFEANNNPIKTTNSDKSTLNSRQMTNDSLY